MQYEHPQTSLNLTAEVFVPMATGDTSYEVDAAVSVFVSGQLKTFPQSKQGKSTHCPQKCIISVIRCVTDIQTDLSTCVHYFGLEISNTHMKQKQSVMNALLKSDVTRCDHVSVVMDAGSRIVNFIRDGTVFAYL